MTGDPRGRGLTRRPASRLAGSLLAPAVAILLSAPVAAAQSPDELRALKQEIEALRERQEATERELKEIRTLLRGRPATAPVDAAGTLLRVEADPFKGERTARLTLVEFSDYQCPFCGRHFRETLPQIEKEYVLTGKVKYVFRDFPIESIHKDAFKAHEAARCAGDQAKYWEMHDRLFAHPRALSPKDLALHAEALGLDPALFQQCLETGKHAAGIRKAMGDGRSAGVRATPTFFLGVTAPNGAEVRVARVIRGAQRYAAFKEAIDALLSPQSE